jgi:hypothetical protein
MITIVVSQVERIPTVQVLDLEQMATRAHAFRLARAVHAREHAPIIVAGVADIPSGVFPVVPHGIAPEGIACRRRNLRVQRSHADEGEDGSDLHAGRQERRSVRGRELESVWECGRCDAAKDILASGGRGL